MATHGWGTAGPLEIQIAAFLDELTAAGYAPQRLTQRLHYRGVRAVGSG